MRISDIVAPQRDYKDYLKERVRQNAGRRGYIAALAQAAGCQRSYFSQMIRGSAHLTPDHAIGLCEFWELSENETEYFMLLVEHARAATPRLRRRLETRLSSLRKRLNSVGGRLQDPPGLEAGQELRYYASWHTVAIHLLCGFPKAGAVEDIAERLQLPRALVARELELLAQLGLVSERKGAWKSSSPQLHLPRESPMAMIHHANWRDRAVAAARVPGGDGLHFTAVHSLSQADFLRVREVLLESFQKAKKIVEPSPEEELACIACDYFKV
ncbi:MAG: TIGR02147 family protein [Oligoflexia bacterium]|nr:TIGR02147 family protein [Oligoflexia bacterium]